MIHPTAIIDPKARVAQGVEIGAYSVIGSEVEIGEQCKIASHVVIQGPTKMGKRNKVYQFASVGEVPQNLSFKGERTWLEIGDDNTIRECCTLNRGSADGSEITKIGDHNLFMAYAHVAHDCYIGNHTIFANNASIAGHVVVGDFAGLGAFVGVHQFCRIGAYSFLGRSTKVVQDILPYMLVSGNPGVPSGINLVGLKRQGFDSDTLRFLKEAFKMLYLRGLKLTEARKQLEQMISNCPPIQLLVQAIEESTRGIARFGG